MAERVARLEGQYDQLREDLQRIERKADERFDKVDARFEKLESALAAVKDGLAEFRLEMKSALAAIEKSRVAHRVWQLLIHGAMLGVMARGFHWI